MSRATLEEILEEAEALPPDERRLLREVLNSEMVNALLAVLAVPVLISLVEKTHSLPPGEQQQLRETLNRSMADSGSMNKTEMVRAVRGKYAHLPTGSEEFAALKRQDIELEDRR
jgi:hypothetical protein